MQNVMNYASSPYNVDKLRLFVFYLFAGAKRNLFLPEYTHGIRLVERNKLTL
jgi:hypothetical protein